MNPHKILGGLPKSNTYTHRCIGFVSFLGKKSLFKLKEGDYNIVHKACAASMLAVNKPNIVLRLKREKTIISKVEMQMDF